MWLHEIKPGTEEADRLARRIMNSLARAWEFDHNIEATAVVQKIGKEKTEWEEVQLETGAGNRSFAT